MYRQVGMGTPQPPPADAKPEDYIYVRLWGKGTYSNCLYIRKMQKEAAEDKAPLAALFPRMTINAPEEDGTSKWRCLEELNATHWFREYAENCLKEIAEKEKK